MTATTSPVLAVVPLPDLVGAAASRVSGAGRLDVAIHLHGMCMRVAASLLDLNLGTDHGHCQAYKLADAMLTVIQEHILFHGHPHCEGGEFATLADWLLGRSVVEARAEIEDAAAWWRSLQQPERLR